MAINVSLDGGAARSWAGPFYAIRIGTGANNDIVISGAAEGVHEHHCTLVHTGSSYRIEMLPTHLVFIDGELAECGQQLFLKNTRRCVLSIGGAPPVRGGPQIDPPPQVTCERTGEATDPAVVTIGGKPQYNRNRLRELRKWVTALAWVLLLGLPAVAGTLAWNGWQDSRDRTLIAELAEKAGNAPTEAEIRQALGSVVQLGLQGEDGVFLPVGSGWVWKAPAGLRIVTNIHVMQQLSGPGVPSLRLRHSGVTHVAALPDGAGAYRAHPNYDAFNKALARRGRDLGVPNVYDIAVLALPDMPGVNPDGLGLELATRPPGIGSEVMMIGFPLEGDADIARLSALATLRAGRIGRVSDPFGVPAPSIDRDAVPADGFAASEGAYLIITGATAQGGESGSPLIGEGGKVTGMTFAGFFEQAADLRTGTRDQAGTVKLKALNARLLHDILDTPAGAGPVRRDGWDAGLDYLNADVETSLLAQRERDTCRNRDAARTLVYQQAGLAVDMARRTPVPGQTGYAAAGEVQLSSEALAGPQTHAFVVVARSASTPKSLISLRAKHPRTGQVLATNDLSSSLVAVNFNLTTTPDSAPQTLRYGLYADQQGPVDIAVYRIDCGPES